MKFITLQRDDTGGNISIATHHIAAIRESDGSTEVLSTYGCLRVLERRKQILQMIKQVEGTGLPSTEVEVQYLPSPKLSLSDPIEGVETARLVVICGCGVILETPAEYREHHCGCENCGNARTRLSRNDKDELLCEKCR